MIKIETEKIIERGEKRVKVLKTEALSPPDLPKKYTDGYPSVKKTNYGIQMRNLKNDYEFLYENTSYTKKEFEKKLDVIKAAGERLSEINKELLEKNKDWKGNETFLI